MTEEEIKKIYLLELDEGEEEFSIYYLKTWRINDGVQKEGFYLRQREHTLNPKHPCSTLERAQENLKTEIKLILMRQKSEAKEKIHDAEMRLRDIEGLEKIINKKGLEEFELKQE